MTDSQKPSWYPYWYKQYISSVKCTSKVSIIFKSVDWQLYLFRKADGKTAKILLKRSVSCKSMAFSYIWDKRTSLMHLLICRPITYLYGVWLWYSYPRKIIDVPMEYIIDKLLTTHMLGISGCSTDFVDWYSSWSRGGIRMHVYGSNLYMWRRFLLQWWQCRIHHFNQSFFGK